MELKISYTKLVIGLIAVLVLGLAVGLVVKNKNQPGRLITIQSQDYDELAKDDEVFVLDVHTPEQKHLPNTNAFVPYDQISRNLSVLPKNKQTPILVYCRSGSMSKIAAEELIKMGYKTVYDLEGGANAYKESHAQVVISPQTYDFGRVRYGDVSRTEFSLTNQTPSNLKITRISTSCSCTQAKIEKTLLLPGESTVIKVSFDPSVHKDDTDLGQLTRTIFIKTDNPNYPRLTAEITADVYKDTKLDK